MDTLSVLNVRVGVPVQVMVVLRVNVLVAEGGDGLGEKVEVQEGEHDFGLGLSVQEDVQLLCVGVPKEADTVLLPVKE